MPKDGVVSGYDSFFELIGQIMSFLSHILKRARSKILNLVSNAPGQTASAFLDVIEFIRHFVFYSVYTVGNIFLIGPGLGFGRYTRSLCTDLGGFLRHCGGSLCYLRISVDVHNIEI